MDYRDFPGNSSTNSSENTAIISSESFFTSSPENYFRDLLEIIQDIRAEVPSVFFFRISRDFFSEIPPFFPDVSSRIYLNELPGII